MAQEQEAQDKAISDLSDTANTQQGELDDLRAEMQRAMAAATAAADGLAQLQHALDRLDAKPGDSSGAAAAKVSEPLLARASLCSLCQAVWGCA